MWADLPPLLGDFTDMQSWLIPVVGLVSAATALVVGKLVLGKPRKRTDLAAPPPSPKAMSQPGPDRDPFVYGSAAERRVALRRNGNPIAILVSDAEVKTEPYRGWVLDRSTGGMCLAVANEVEKGAVLSVRAVNAPTTTPWVQLEVKSCRQVEGDWELGCQFVKTPSWSVLLMFG